MRDRVTLPRVVGLRLKDFQPIFQQDVTMSLNGGPFIILGGNGLGKTTIMQAIIYGLVGGASENIEQEKSLRWNHVYFRQRLDRNRISSSYVEIDFAFGKTKMSVRRGFNNPSVSAFKLERSKDWIEDPVEAKMAYENALTQYGGYETTEDLAFLVHRLLYLPETRRLLAWDSDSQMRIIMLLNQDALIEEDFRRRRRELKELDSNKRHIHVALGKVTARLEMLNKNKRKAAKGANKATPVETDKDLKTLIVGLQEVVRLRLEIDKDVQTATKNLSSISSEIEGLREKIEQVEASLIANLLLSQEKENALPLYKMAENGICPVCGTRQRELQVLAHKHFIEHRCMLCGSEEPQETEPELSTLRSQLAEKIRSQQSLEDTFRIANNKLDRIRHQEEHLQYEVNKIRYAQPVITLIERDLPPTTGKDLLQTKLALEQQEDDFQAQILRRQSELERDYKNFRAAVDARINRLRDTYATYATNFLGIPCELTEIKTSDLITFTRFVPMFNGIARETPESCSEAQRFFLDIAFRLALIDQASEGTKDKATFICETPESALDMSYVDNVVNMFTQFLKKGHSLLLTANIQTDSMAAKLLKVIPKKEHSSHVLNLLDIGQLSNVHKKALPALRRVARRIVA